MLYSGIITNSIKQMIVGIMQEHNLFWSTQCEWSIEHSKHATFGIQDIF